MIYHNPRATNHIQCLVLLFLILVDPLWNYGVPWLFLVSVVERNVPSELSRYVICMIFVLLKSKFQFLAPRNVCNTDIEIAWEVCKSLVGQSLYSINNIVLLYSKSQMSCLYVRLKNQNRTTYQFGQVSFWGCPKLLPL